MLQALRDHILGTVVLFVEASDGTALLHVHGSLVEGDRDPDTWATAEQFAVIGPGANRVLWHLREDFRKQLGRPDVQPAATLPTIPDKGIESYIAVDAGASGYRFDLGGGAKMVLLFCYDTLPVSASGDVAPGTSGFTGTAEEVLGGEDDDGGGVAPQR